MTKGHRADGPAVDTGRGDACKETAVEPLIAAIDCLPAECRVELQVSNGEICRRARPGAMPGEVLSQNCILETLLKVLATLPQSNYAALPPVYKPFDTEPLFPGIGPAR